MFAMEYKKIGLNVLFYRRAKGWTQQQLSTQSSVSRSRISDIERGREAIKLETLMMLANALEIDYRVLLENKEKSYKNFLGGIYYARESRKSYH